MVPLGATLFGQLSLSACAEWLWSGYAVKHPDLKIIMSEGGIGWVAMLHDRLENIVDRSGYGHYFPGDLRPAEILHRNFWFSHDRRPVDAVDAGDGRRRPHHVRVRLPARRRHVARHAGSLRRGVRRALRRRDREDLARERGPAVPAPAAPARRSPRSRSPDLTKGTLAAKPVHRLAPRYQSGLTGTWGTNRSRGGVGWNAKDGLDAAASRARVLDGLTARRRGFRDAGVGEPRRAGSTDRGRRRQPDRRDLRPAERHHRNDHQLPRGLPVE